MLVGGGSSVATYEHAFPIEGSLILPVSMPLGGPLEVRLQAHGSDGTPTSADAEVRLRPCAGGQERPEPPRGREGWCCINKEVRSTIAEYCREEGGIFFADPRAAQNECRRIWRTGGPHAESR